MVCRVIFLVLAAGHAANCVLAVRKCVVHDCDMARIVPRKPDGSANQAWISRLRYLSQRGRFSDFTQQANLVCGNGARVASGFARQKSHAGSKRPIRQ